MDKRILEIDVLKGVGICMVLINHSYDYVYTSALLFKLSRSCVQLLLFCAGVNMFLKIRKLLAADRPPRPTSSWQATRLWGPQMLRIMVPYVIFDAGFVVLWKKTLDLSLFWKHLWGFDIAAPVYFIPVYLSLVFAAPFFYWAVMRFPGRLWTLCLCVLSAGAFLVCARRTYVLPVYGAGQYLLGASYGWVFVLGMIWGRYLHRRGTPVQGSWRRMAAAAALLAGWIVTLELFPEAHARLERLLPPLGGNPPGPDSLLEGSLIIWNVWELTACLKEKWGERARAWLRPLAACGRYSLYIFLWHMFVKAGWNQCIAAAGFPKQSVFYAIPFYLGSTVLVVLGKKGVDYLKQDMQDVLAGKKGCEKR